MREHEWNKIRCLVVFLTGYSSSLFLWGFLAQQVENLPNHISRGAFLPLNSTSSCITMGMVPEWPTTIQLGEISLFTLDWLIDWLMDGLIDWMIDWLNDWLIDGSCPTKLQSSDQLPKTLVLPLPFIFRGFPVRDRKQDEVKRLHRKAGVEHWSPKNSLPSFPWGFFCF